MAKKKKNTGPNKYNYVQRYISKYHKGDYAPGEYRQLLSKYYGLLKDKDNKEIRSYLKEHLPREAMDDYYTDIRVGIFWELPEALAILPHDAVIEILGDELPKIRGNKQEALEQYRLHYLPYFRSVPSPFFLWRMTDAIDRDGKHVFEFDFRGSGIADLPAELQQEEKESPTDKPVPKSKSGVKDQLEQVRASKESVREDIRLWKDIDDKEALKASKQELKDLIAREKKLLKKL